MDYFFRSFIFQNVFDLRCFRLSCHLSLVSFSVMLKSIMNNTMRILIWKIYMWDYWGPYAQHISRVELTKYANTKLFLRHLNKSKKSEIFILYKDLTLSEPSRDIKSYKEHQIFSKKMKHAFFHGKYIFEATHHDMCFEKKRIKTQC